MLYLNNKYDIKTKEKEERHKMKNKVIASNPETLATLERERERERESYSLLSIEKNHDLIKLNRLII